MMSVLGFKPGEVGNSIMLTRLEKGSEPLTVHIDTSKFTGQVRIVSELQMPGGQTSDFLMAPFNANYTACKQQLFGSFDRVVCPA